MYFAKCEYSYLVGKRAPECDRDTLTETLMLGRHSMTQLGPGHDDTPLPRYCNTQYYDVSHVGGEPRQQAPGHDTTWFALAKRPSAGARADATHVTPRRHHDTVRVGGEPQQQALGLPADAKII